MLGNYLLLAREEKIPHCYYNSFTRVPCAPAGATTGSGSVSLPGLSVNWSSAHALMKTQGRVYAELTMNRVANIGYPLKPPDK